MCIICEGQDISGLKILDCCGCTNLQSLPRLPDSLKCLSCEGCTNIQTLPHLPNLLVELYCGGCINLQTLPPFSWFIGTVRL